MHRICSITLLTAGLALSGCLSLPQTKAPTAEVLQINPESPEGESQVPVANSPYLPSPLSADQIRYVLLQLDEAERAMRNKQYTTPAGNNALERYQAVLALIPDHQEARKGVLEIANNYLDWAYAALRQGDRAVARRYLQRAKRADGLSSRAQTLQMALDAQAENEVVKDQGAEVASPSRSEKSALAPAIAPSPVGESAPSVDSIPGVDTTPVVESGRTAEDSVAAEAQPRFAEDLQEWEVNADALEHRDAGLALQLAGLADLIESRRSRVTIQAPTDADGRWLYQQLNERRLEYRIRANFERAKLSRIILLD